MIKLMVTIPVNTSATITLPKAPKTTIEAGEPLSVSGFKAINESVKGLVIEAGSGNYVFEYKWN